MIKMPDRMERTLQNHYGFQIPYRRKIISDILSGQLTWKKKKYHPGRIRGYGQKMHTELCALLGIEVLNRNMEHDLAEALRMALQYVDGNALGSAAEPQLNALDAVLRRYDDKVKQRAKRQFQTVKKMETND